MNKKEKRHLELLGFIEKNKTVANHELLSFLENSIDRKTLQRDLKALESKFLITIKKAGSATKYTLSSNYLMHKAIDIKNYFDTHFKKRVINQNFNFDLLDYLKQELFTRREKELLNNCHQQFISNISRYDSQTLINKEYQRIMIEFSWKSSAIEGNTYDILATEALINYNLKDNSKTKEEAQMILNHKDAFNLVMQNKADFEKISLANIEYVHRQLTKKTGIKANLRNTPVGIAGTNYKPLDNQHQIKEALEKAIALINNKQCFFEKSFIALMMLSYIQGFEDGNKRIARMTSNALLLANSSLPLSYRAVDIIQYKKASILFYEINNISYFKQIFIEQYQDAVNEYFC